MIGIDKVKKVIVLILKFISSFFPKKKKVLIASADGYRGNAKALAESISSNTDWPILWVSVNRRSEVSYQSANIPYVKAYSIQFWMALFSSKWLVSTHGELGRFKAFRGQCFVNLWHGIMLKKLGNMWSSDEGAYLAGVCNNADITTTNSAFVSGLFALCFNAPLWKMNETGSPRNDWLLDDVVGAQKLKQVLGRSYEKAVLYCPTHRKSEGKGRVQESLWCYEDFKVKYLNAEFLDYLERKNIVFVVKLHPFEESKLSLDEFSSTGRVVVITGEALDKEGIDLYEVLAGFDALITDYSSIYIDYLLTGKPVIFMTDDLDQYRSNRGFVFDMYEELTPGPKLACSEDFAGVVDKCLSDASFFDEKRGSVLKLLNSASPSYSENVVRLMEQFDGK